MLFPKVNSTIKFYYFSDRKTVKPLTIQKKYLEKITDKIKGICYFLENIINTGKILQLREELFAMEDSIRVFIVDDNKGFCSMVKEYLSAQESFDVIGTAHNGQECLEFLENEKPDIMILDLIMPHLDGIGVMEELNNSDLGQDLKVIILTAFGQEELAQKMAALGAKYYIMKPIDLTKLGARIKQLANTSNSRSLNTGTRVDLNLKITEIMHDLGVPAHIKGYLYLRKSIELVINNINLMGAVTKELYPAVADHFNTTPSKVERAIRHAIEVTWNRGNIELLNKYFRNTIPAASGKATNSQFIARIADELRLKLKVS